MGGSIIHVAPDFWNIRGSFKVGGLVDIGTHVSLVRRSNGKFVFIDSYTLSDEVDRKVRASTNGGADIEAVLNVHPFHTVHVRNLHGRFPNAKLYGTERHIAKFPELPWESLRTEDAALHEQFAEDFDFSVPRGVDFISKNENVHFSSVLVRHRTSKTIHVDDTLTYLRLPKVARVLGRSELFRFHPTLRQALERRSGACRDFRAWAQELAERWRDTQNLCAAHSAVLSEARNRGPSIHARILGALEKAEGKLRPHEKKYG